MRSKYELLKLFTAAIAKVDPMGLKATNNPLEYESEALSILSRFNEAAVHVTGKDDESLTTQIATMLVKQAFEFWFNEEIKFDIEKLTVELLKIYRQPAEKKKDVKSVTIG